MRVNKVIYGTETLIDLTNDSVTPETLKKGVTAHDKSGEVITGTLEETSYIEYILLSQTITGIKEFSDDSVVTITDSETGYILTKTYSNNFSKCTSVLNDTDGNELGYSIKEIMFDDSDTTIINIFDRNGNVVNRYVKTYSNGYRRITTS